jgi:hypothetical protein
MEQNILCTGSSSGQLVLWHICDEAASPSLSVAEECTPRDTTEPGISSSGTTPQVKPFMVLVSDSVAIRAVLLGLSNLREEVFVSISANGTVGVWDTRDGRCIAYRRSLIQHVASPEKAIVFDNGRLVAVIGNGPEIEIVNVWTMETLKLVHEHGDWVTAISAFDSRTGHVPIHYDKAGRAMKRGSFNLSRGGLFSMSSNLDSKLCFVSFTSDNRLYTWQLSEEEGMENDVHFNVTCHEIVQLEFVKSADQLGRSVGTNVEVEKADFFGTSSLIDPCDISISPSNDVIAIIGKDNVALLHRRWIHEFGGKAPIMALLQPLKTEMRKSSAAKLETAKTESQRRLSLERINYINCWKGGNLVDDGRIQVCSVDGRTWIYEIPLVSHSYAIFQSELSKGMYTDPKMVTRFCENDKSRLQHDTANQQVGFNSTTINYYFTQSGARKDREYCIRSTGSDEITIWRLSRSPLMSDASLSNLSDSMVSIKREFSGSSEGMCDEISPFIVSGLRDSWQRDVEINNDGTQGAAATGGGGGATGSGTTASEGGSDSGPHTGITCTAVTMSLGGCSEGGCTPFPLPSIIAKGYSDGQVSVALFPTDPKPYFLSHKHRTYIPGTVAFP